jgi:hypothetical protein
VLLAVGGLAPLFLLHRARRARRTRRRAEARTTLKLLLLQIGLAIFSAPVVVGCCSPLGPDTTWPVRPARVVSLRENKNSKRPVFYTVVEVQAPQGPYRVETTASVPFINLAEFHPGSMIHVRVNPEDHQYVEVVFCEKMRQGGDACERYETHLTDPHVTVCR